MKRLHQTGPNTSYQVDQSCILKSLSQLWERTELCDCVLVSSDQISFHTHRLMLAAASHYFKVLFLGTGQQMLNSISQEGQGLSVVHLDEVDGHSLELVLEAIYQPEFQVEP